MNERDKKRLEELEQQIRHSMAKGDEQIRSAAELLKKIPPENWRKNPRTLNLPQGIVEALYAYNRGEIDFEQVRSRFLDATVAPYEN